MRTLICLPFVLVACGSASETDLETAFCSLLQSGPEEEHQAADGQGSGPELAVGDAVVELDLPTVAGGHGGWARYTPDEAGSFVFGLSEDIDVFVLDATGAEIAPIDTVAGAACDELAVRHTFELELAAYAVYFEAVTTDEIDFVSEESDDDL